jgi:hypothetical protein
MQSKCRVFKFTYSSLRSFQVKKQVILSFGLFGATTSTQLKSNYKVKQKTSITKVSSIVLPIPIDYLTIRCSKIALPLALEILFLDTRFIYSSIQTQKNSYFVNKVKASLSMTTPGEYLWKYIFFVAPRPNAGHGLLILEVSRSHTTTHYSRWDSFG